MRVLTVSNVPLEASLGSGYVILGYVEQLRSRGHDVTTLEPRQYFRFPRWPGARRLRLLLGYTAAVRRALAARPYDVVELWGGEAWRIARELAPRPARPLLVGRSNGFETLRARDLASVLGPPRASWAGRRFDRWQDVPAAFRAVDLLTTVSERETAFALAERYQPADRIVTLPNPLSAEWHAELPGSSRPQVLAYFGSWLPVKGSALLPTLFSAALRAHPAWRGRIVGPAPAEIAPHFPDDVRARIEFVPHVSDKAHLRRLYLDSAIVLLPSIYESFGLVAAEALACGCALVASPTGWAASLAPSAAVLVAERSPAAWIAALLPLLADEPRRRELAMAGRASTRTLRWPEAGERLEAAYRAALATR
jgi:glycosyltransferase involved in cell wall biosynthesis